VSVSTAYLLDTNVISEIRRVRPHPGVLAFMSSVRPAKLFLSVLTIGELRKGVENRRRSDPTGADKLETWVDGIEATFADRVLPIDADIARRWGELSATRPLPVIDTLLAATAITRNLSLVTRNTSDVISTGVALVDPWQS
jgi:predicted nucleic acid-binding protein